jgi:uncharacterized protein YegL
MHDDSHAKGAAMADQFEYKGFQASEFAENPEQRLPCVLLLDTSDSMSTVVGAYERATGETVYRDGQTYNLVSGGKTRIDLLNEGLIALKETLTADSLTSRRAEIAIITFGGTVTIVQDFVTADIFQPPHLRTSGNTPMGEAILAALEMVTKRKATYRAAGILYYRPLIFMITDGEPNDGDPWQAAADKVREGEANKSFAFFTVGVEDADMSVLKHISPSRASQLKKVNFREMFVWLSKSMQSVTQSTPGTAVNLPLPNWTV